MKTHLLFTLAALCCAATLRAQTPVTEPAPDNPLRGPISCRNLQVFLITADDRLTDVQIKTLDESMKEKTTVVQETGSVNQLSIQNKGKKTYVFAQAGDIVKGGRQDRTLGSDLLVKPASGKLPVDAFCVEHGRWSQRGAESAAAFSGSSKSLSSKELKYAAKVEKSQGKVWDNVEKAQKKLSDNVYKSKEKKEDNPIPQPVARQTTKAVENVADNSPTVNDTRSATSLQLSLENKQLEALAKEYIAALKDVPEKEEHCVGFAYAVNGVMSGAEIYANHPLFLKLWDKLLESAVHEAISEEKDGADGKALTAAEVQSWLGEAQSSDVQKESHPADNVTLKRDAKKTVRFDTLMPVAKGKAKESDWVHRSILGKEGMVASTPTVQTPAINSNQAPPQQQAIESR
jgi:hypothetical protein